MSGDTDRLAQIADFTEAWMAGQHRRDVLALVEIAKAARGVRFLMLNDAHGRYCAISFEHRDALRAALTEDSQ